MEIYSSYVSSAAGWIKKYICPNVHLCNMCGKPFPSRKNEYIGFKFDRNFCMQVIVARLFAKSCVPHPIKHPTPLSFIVIKKIVRSESFLIPFILGAKRVSVSNFILIFQNCDLYVEHKNTDGQADRQA